MHLPRLFAFACLLGLMTPAAPAQSSLPKETPLFITAKKDDDRLDEKIYPIGWSKDGKFAWLSRKVEEASDEGMWALSVLDVAGNKVAETTPFEYKDKAGEGLAKFWAKHGKAIQVTLVKHEIKAGPMVMDHLPVVLGNRRNYILAADITTKEPDKDDNNAFGIMVKSFKVNARVAQKTSVVYEKTYNALMPFAVTVSGCFHSPDERFAVLVVTALERGYEGPPHARVVEAMVGVQLEMP